jgi:cellulose synthase/poly-beta-1,6-N-acetylglucosamine synthase-like glycosyltransferase
MRRISPSRQQSTFDPINQELSFDVHAGVSVIVCAKNEALRLDTLIPKILEQNYQNFELIIVDDHSTDQT